MCGLYLCLTLLLVSLEPQAHARIWQEGDVRLLDGPRRYMGTVAVLRQGAWVAVCDDGWDVQDASVVCRQLGYTFALRATSKSEFGPSRRKVVISRVQCKGQEARLDQCAYQTLGSGSKCSGRYNAAGVICSSAISATFAPPAKTNPSKIPQRLATSTSDLGTTTSSRATSGVSASTTDTQGTGGSTGQTDWTGVTTGTSPAQTSGTQLLHTNVAQTDSTTSPADVTTTAENNTDGLDSYQADEPQLENMEIRLSGGRYAWEGHVQVNVNGKWGAICSDHWTIREVMVTCSQLGQFGRAKQALLTSFFGGEDQPKIFYRIKCVGREKTLAACNLTRTDKQEGHSCSKNSAVAGAVCSQYLPDLVPSLRAIEDSMRLQDQPLYYLTCAMEENCLASSAARIKETSLSWRNSLRRLLRFSTVVHNRGNADFKPLRPRAQWQWHACHMHYHSMEVFAHYDIVDQDGARLAEGSKASFCLEDTVCDNGAKPVFNCRGFAEQGLSVNCSDNYLYDIDCQWIDITDVKPGKYTFQMEVNPSMLVAESNYDNNVVICQLDYTGYYASVRGCSYSSLLDYKRSS